MLLCSTFLAKQEAPRKARAQDVTKDQLLGTSQKVCRNVCHYLLCSSDCTAVLLCNEQPNEKLLWLKFIVLSSLVVFKTTLKTNLHHIMLYFECGWNQVCVGNVTVMHIVLHPNASLPVSQFRAPKNL